MNLQIFFDNLELLAEAPNGIQKLRELILQLAVMGKLAPQDPDDEPASVLLEKIKIEKQCLIEKGKIKREKPLPCIQSNELHFTLPSKWHWVRLGNALIKLTDGTHNSPLNTEKGDYKYITAKNIKQGNIDLTNITYVTANIHKEIYTRCNPEYGDILYIKDGATTGIVAINTLVEQFSMLSSVALLKLPCEIDNRYLFYMLSSPYFYSQMRDDMSGVAITRVTLSKLNKALIPLPPLAEQHRIVAKVDQLMKLCDELEARQQKKLEARVTINNTAIAQLLTACEPEEFNKSWQRIYNNFDLLYSTPENIGKLRQAILQLAVMGKLAPQDPRDEPASILLDKIKFEKERLAKEGKINRVKKLPLINLDEIPYQLPKTWCWVRLGCVISLMDAGWSPACKNYSTQDESKWGVLKTTAVQELEYKQEENKELPEDLEPHPQYEVKAGDILITRAGPKNRVGICCLVKNTRSRLMISDKIIRLHVIDKYIFSDFVVLSLNSGFSKSFIETQKSGMAASQMNISQEKLQNTPTPIPPLAEQHRIVAKVNQLMTLCDQLEAQLKQSVADSEKLMETAVRQLLDVNTIAVDDISAEPAKLETKTVKQSSRKTQSCVSEEAVQLNLPLF